jgi:hypothetical protein
VLGLVSFEPILRMTRVYFLSTREPFIKNQYYKEGRSTIWKLSREMACSRTSVATAVFVMHFRPGTDVMILKYFCQKIGENVGVFLLKTKLN